MSSSWSTGYLLTGVRGRPSLHLFTLVPDLRFHTLIVEACHNELLEEILKVLRAVFILGPKG